jgi:hypothetical protein
MVIAASVLLGKTEAPLIGCFGPQIDTSTRSTRCLTVIDESRHTFYIVDLGRTACQQRERRAGPDP